MFEKILSSILGRRSRPAVPLEECVPRLKLPPGEASAVGDVLADGDERLLCYYGCSSLKELSRAATKSGIREEYLLRVAGRA